MLKPIQQTRLTIRKLRVDETNTSKTLCYSAHVYFDGRLIAKAINRGHGGDAHVFPVKGAKDEYAEARAFVSSLPPLQYDVDDSAQTLAVTFEYLVGCLAFAMHVNRLVRRSFVRCMRSRLMLIKNEKVFYPVANIRGKDLDDMTEVERRTIFAQVRSLYGSDTIVLAELEREEAFALYNKYIRKE